MTNFDVCSDLHLEFDLDDQGCLDQQYLESVFGNAHSDNLIIAGDLLAVPLDNEYCVQLFDDAIDAINQFVRQRYRNALFVLGNHDYWYHYNVQSTVDFWTEKLTAFKVLDIHTNPVFELDDLVIFGSTGWTQIDDLFAKRLAEQNMNDYRHTHLTVNLTSQIAQRTRDQIDQVATKYKDRKMMVITHHAPLPQCQKGHNFLPEAYFNDWHTLIDDHSNIVEWVYGHVHQRRQIKYNHCTVTNNARGYSGDSEFDNFSVKKIIV